METKPQMLVRLNSNENFLFDLKDYDEFLGILHRLNNDSNGWILLTFNNIVKKELLEAIVYYPEGYAKNSESNMPKD
jgi:hypothetical protein